MKKKKIREKLYDYIDNAKGKQLKNFLSIVEEDSVEYSVKKKYNHWNDPEFVKEMDRRVEEYESGKVKGIPWEEVHGKALERLRNKKENGK
ncbi:MAG TPA: addiction module protein [Chitinophagaceae bacterium]